MKKLSEIFEIDYPNTNIFYKNVPDKNGINFVSAKATDNGIAGRVKFTKEFKIYPAKSITVTIKRICFRTIPSDRKILLCPPNSSFNAFNRT